MPGVVIKAQTGLSIQAQAEIVIKENSAHWPQPEVGIRACPIEEMAAPLESGI